VREFLESKSEDALPFGYNPCSFATMKFFPASQNLCLKPINNATGQLSHCDICDLLRCLVPHHWETKRKISGICVLSSLPHIDYINLLSILIKLIKLVSKSELRHNGEQ
jgi:hypothetical protein